MPWCKRWTPWNLFFGSPRFFIFWISINFLFFCFGHTDRLIAPTTLNQLLVKHRLYHCCSCSVLLNREPCLSLPHPMISSMLVDHSSVYVAIRFWVIVSVILPRLCRTWACAHECWAEWRSSSTKLPSNTPLRWVEIQHPMIACVFFLFAPIGVLFPGHFHDICTVQYQQN